MAEEGGNAENDHQAGEAMSKAEREEILGLEDGLPMYKGRGARFALTDLKLVDLDDPGDTEGLLVAPDEEPDDSDEEIRR
ncbi:MAG TPA: hypothetical protein VHZ54_14185 [Solirubrobacterales bacterium]|jgi:hypothetical protein|nr:hypothetical protein [Solirubrobacterales bacterium]